jgi:hypothetical protein
MQPVLFAFSYFLDRVSCFHPRLTSDHDPSTYAGIIDMCSWDCSHASSLSTFVKEYGNWINSHMPGNKGDHVLTVLLGKARMKYPLKIIPDFTIL